MVSNVKVLFVMIDGLSDNNIKKLSNKTPLQSQEFNSFNALASSGLNGIHDPVESGLACGSDTAHMNIFGYNPFKLYSGRGSFETMGTGISMDFDDIAFKCNFAYMNLSNGIVERRRVDREFEKWGVPLCNEIEKIKIPGYEKYKITCLHATEHRCGIKISGPGLSADISGTDPIVDNKPLQVSKPNNVENNDATMTADLVNKFSIEITKVLLSHPINIERKAKGLFYTNIILLRGCGSRLKVPFFKEKHHMVPFMIAPTAVIAGIGMTFGFDIFIAKGATGYYDTNLLSKAEKAISIFREGKHDFGFIHIKAIDDAGHD